ncbi:hypothetical protein [Yoonia sp.]|uniref:hypothetical protein n=1 Tax=Yoonia sp. TaxID=2212373 RepID=UPI00358F3CBF
MNKDWKRSRAAFVLALLGGTALAACAPSTDCVEVPEGLVVSDIASGKVAANPLPRCKTDWARPIVSVENDSDSVVPDAPATVSPVSPEPPVDNDETSTADTPRADGDGNGITGQSGASVTTAGNTGASSSSQTATERSVAAARIGAASVAAIRDTGASSSNEPATESSTAAAGAGGAVSASAIDDGVGVSISRDENGRLSVTFVGQDD